MLALVRLSLFGAAVSLGLQLLAGFLGMAGVLVNLLVPVPLAYVAMLGGMPAGGLAAFIAFVVAWATGGPWAMAVFAIQFAAPALILAGLLRRSVPWDRAIAVGTLLVFAVGFAGLWIYASRSGVGMIETVNGYLQSEIDTALKMGEAGNLTADQLAEYRRVVTGMGDFLRVTFPGWSVLVVEILMAVQVLFLNRLAHGRFHLAGSEFRRWKTHELLIWPLIAAGFAGALGDGVLRIVGLNLLLVILPAYFLQGMAIVTWFFARKGVPPVMRGAGYVLIAVINPLPVIVTGIGVFDLWVDFRQPRLKRNKQ
ncbi:uncharacterized protein YybS (DUF2232 family) [Geothermobacter ehrlichii]|uniref:Uncharacterized protein YybS (DUF2232 family) n=1 Tax=Geothermobacter ehrlichii TaxID=213224 RepID=A0A5D3WKD0_9BACT|nr:DUF2232 domain-containing protein [Geothermobacter ehrlichii]TYO98651.1 uncharacterized protein YybS (DUF2232 family) [Geothermobacter ehrlichii]